MTGLAIATTTAMARRQRALAYPHGHHSNLNNLTAYYHNAHAHAPQPQAWEQLRYGYLCYGHHRMPFESQPHDHDPYIDRTSMVTAVAITATTFTESTKNRVYDGHDHIVITNETVMMLTIFATYNHDTDNDFAVLFHAATI
ncbi:hypothetical protein BGW80DRAFT_1448347 [Lactifluus volemus]|nr:hypothetical protein BGW80DRAFT_1448347 [Lactifluus volemus]